MGEGLLYSKSSGGLIYYGGRFTLWHRIGKWGASFVGGLKSWKLGRGKHWKWSGKWGDFRRGRESEGTSFQKWQAKQKCFAPFFLMRGGYVACLPPGPTLLQYNYQNFPSRLKVILTIFIHSHMLLKWQMFAKIVINL